MTIKGIYRRIRNYFFPKEHNKIVKKIVKLQRDIPLLKKQYESYKRMMLVGFVLNNATLDEYFKIQNTLYYYKDQLSLLKKQYKQYYCK